MEGCDLLTIRDGLVRENRAYMNATEMARQLGAHATRRLAPARRRCSAP